jgi:hypothetical protein
MVMMLFKVAFLTMLVVTNSLSLHIPIKVIKDAYVTSLNTRPMLTNCATAGILAACSDFISQNIEIANQKRLQIKDPGPKNPPSFSIYRSFCMFNYGFFVLGWFVTHWFRFLNYLIPREDITVFKALKKIAINQICMSPVLNSFFFAYIIFTRGKR